MDITQLDRYQKQVKIGESAMSTIYKAYDAQMQRDVSIKILKPSESVKRDIAKMKLYIGIEHPNLCTMHSVEKYEDTIIIVSDFVEGTPLQKLLVKSEYPDENLLELLLHISYALSVLDTHNLPHGNLKPSNIIIDKNSQPILTDFGLSPFENYQQSPEFVSPYEAIHYLAPEQVKNEPVCRQSDFFAMGVIAYRILFGKLPFQGQNEDELIQSILEYHPKLILSGSNRLNRIYSLLLGNMLAKDKLNRFENVYELKATLSEIKIFDQNRCSQIIVEPGENPRKSLMLSVFVVIVVALWALLSFLS